MRKILEISLIWRHTTKKWLLNLTFTFNRRKFLRSWKFISQIFAIFPIRKSLSTKQFMRISNLVKVSLMKIGLWFSWKIRSKCFFFNQYVNNNIFTLQRYNPPRKIFFFHWNTIYGVGESKNNIQILTNIIITSKHSRKAFLVAPKCHYYFNL